LFRILNLQKDRFFEQLQAKYWNHSSKGSCPTTDDNEGITLESLGMERGKIRKKGVVIVLFLGGVFIATLFGLALAMVTLVGEVLYYRRKRKVQSSEKKKPKVVSVPETWKPGNLPVALVNKEKAPVTFGTEFKPVDRNRDLSDLGHIKLYPRARNRITQVTNN
jgi:ionotropic glutamate receptor